MEIEQHTGGDEGAGERAASGLVGTGDEPDPEVAIESEELARGPGAPAGPALGARPERGFVLRARGSRFGRVASR